MHPLQGRKEGRKGGRETHEAAASCGQVAKRGPPQVASWLEFSTTNPSSSSLHIPTQANFLARKQ